MTRNSSAITFILMLLPAFLFLFVAFQPNSGGSLSAGRMPSATMLALITAAAIAIERTIEGCWTFLGLTIGTWWPFSIVTRQVEQTLEEINQQMAPLYAKAQELAAKGKVAGDALTQAEIELRTMESRLSELRALATSRQTVNLYATAALHALWYIEKRYGNIGNGVKATEQAIAGITDFVESFKDNPGKRLISLAVGTSLGLAIVLAGGFDIFQATGFTVPVFAVAGVALPNLGAAFTGLIIGLGSNPTHEAIRTLQEIKRQRESENALRLQAPRPVAVVTHEGEPQEPFDDARAFAQPRPI